MNIVPLYTGCVLTSPTCRTSSTEVGTDRFYRDCWKDTVVSTQVSKSDHGLTTVLGCVPLASLRRIVAP